MLRTEEFRILVVDAHATERRQFVLWLRRNQFRVVETAGVPHARAHLRRQRNQIDLAILDVAETAHLDLAAELERDEQGPPVLYISSHVDSLVAQAIGWRSPELLLLEPFSEYLLVDRVRRLLQRNAAGAGPGLAPRAECRGEAVRRLG